MTAAAPLLFASLSPVHQSRGRIRYRYRLNAGLPALAPPALERVAQNLPGVTRVRLNPTARSLALHYDSVQTNPERLALALLAIPGAVVTGATGAAIGVAADGDADEHPLGAAGEVLAAGALLLSTRLPLPELLRKPATLAVSAPLYTGALKDLFTEGLNSHVLEALAVAISTASGDRLAANTTLFMLALGEYMEHSIARRSDDLLKHLLHPETDSVWVERDGQEMQVAADAVCVGDTVICAAGYLIPVDGTVLGGEATVNEASMTGESVPVPRKRGDTVLSGTVVEEGRLRVYAERVGSGTASARISSYVQHALQVKSGTQLAASKLADRLVPGVLGLGALSWLVSGDWRRAAAVLQADYACALKLATPVAFKSAMYAAGKQGLLFKGAEALERLAEADTFVFDKTGTLTTGQLDVTDALAFDPAFGPADLIDLAASVEEHYFHPLALAVVEAARRQGGQHFEHGEVRFIAAHGVASVVQGQRIVVGSRHFVEDDEGVPIDAGHRAAIEALEAEGKTLLYIGFGGKLLGVIALKDALRHNTAETIARLRQQGVRRILMLTGDHVDRAAELAAELQLDEFHAQLLPEDKAALLSRLKDEGACIAFIGDGMNDAPALAGAHVGIAMQRGADLARLTSDIALLEDDIGRVADAKALANSTMQRIGSNFRLTVGANTAILAAAATGTITPIASSVLHNGSTIAILLNALRGGLATAPPRRPRSASTRPTPPSGISAALPGPGPDTRRQRIPRGHSRGFGQIKGRHQHADG
ncbi:MAG: heavy metal translocating P-type ATPase [Lautropia sp.]|nr:heavy metal translocating P-type ATPase [Lautropia sp.]